MKKFNLLIAVMLVLGMGVFAQEMVLGVSNVAGNASVTFGVDLDESATGFVNAQTTNNLKFTISGAAKPAKGGDAITGYITLNVTEMSATNAGVTGGVVTVESAGIKFSDTVSLNILGRSKTVDLATHGQGIGPGVAIKTASVTNVAAAVVEEFAGKGVELIVKLPELVDINIGVNSTADYLEPNQNVDNFYNVFTLVSLTAVEDLTFQVGFNFDMSDDTFGLGVKAGYDLGLINVGVGVDLYEEALQIGAGLAVKLGEGKSVASLFATDVAYAEGLTVGFNMNDENIDLSVAFFDGALIPVLDLTVYAALIDVTNDLGLGLGVDARAAIDNITPYVTVILDQDVSLEVKAGVIVAKLADVNGLEEAATLTLATAYKTFDADATPDTLSVTLTAAKFVPLTDFIVKWATEDLADSNGLLTFETKVSF